MPLSRVSKGVGIIFHILLNYFENNSACDGVVNYVVAHILQHLVGLVFEYLKPDLEFRLSL